MRRTYPRAVGRKIARRVCCDAAEVDEYVNPYGVPAFSPRRVFGAVEAAGNALVYYNRLFEGLVPDYCAHFNAHGAYRYGKPTAGIARMFDELYASSETGADGTTENGLVRGVCECAERRGYKAILSDATGTCGGIDAERLRAGLRRELIAIVFFDGYSVAESDAAGADDGAPSYTEIDGRHVALVYGYCDVIRFDGGRKVGRDFYIYALIGGEHRSVAVDFSTIERAYILEIV